MNARKSTDASNSPSALSSLALAGSFALFPAAFIGHLTPVLLGLALAVIGWLLTDRNGTPSWPAWLSVIAALVAYLLPSALVCWTPDGFCRRYGVELGYREAYLVAVGLAMHCAAYVAFTRAGSRYPVVAASFLILYLCVAGNVLATSDDLSRHIGPRRTQLFVTRNDIAPLVGWLFFLHGLLRHGTPNTSIRLASFVTVMLMACILSLANHSRLVAIVTVLGAAFFAPLELRSRRLWSFGVVALAAVLVIEHRNLDELIRRTLLSQGGHESMLARLSLWFSGLRMAMDAPWTGHGVGSFGHAYEAYRQAGAPWATADIRLTPWPHNVFVEVLFDKGIVGLAAFGVLYAWIARNLWHRPVGDLSGLRRPALFLFVSLLVIGLLDSSTIRLWYLPSLLFVLGLSGALRARVRARARDDCAS